MKDPVVHCGTGDGRKVKMGCYDDGAYTNKSISKYRSLAFNQRSRKSRKRDAAETVAEVWIMICVGPTLTRRSENLKIMFGFSQLKHRRVLGLCSMQGQGLSPFQLFPGRRPTAARRAAELPPGCGQKAGVEGAGADGKRRATG